MSSNDNHGFIFWNYPIQSMNLNATLLLDQNVPYVFQSEQKLVSYKLLGLLLTITPI